MEATKQQMQRMSVRQFYQEGWGKTVEREHRNNIVRVPIGKKTYFFSYDGSTHLIAVLEDGEWSLGWATTTAGFAHPDHPLVTPIFD